MGRTFEWSVIPATEEIWLHILHLRTFTRLLPFKVDGQKRPKNFEEEKPPPTPTHMLQRAKKTLKRKFAILSPSHACLKIENKVGMKVKRISHFNLHRFSNLIVVFILV